MARCPTRASSSSSPASSPSPASQWQLFRRRFLRHRLAVISLLVLIILCLLCFGASWIAPFPKNNQDLLRRRGRAERRRTGSAPTASAATSSPRRSTPGRSR